VAVDETTRSDIVVFNKKTLICKGDFTKFVIRNEWGEIEAEFAAEEVDRAPDGRWRAKTSLVAERMKLAIERIRKMMADSPTPYRPVSDAEILMMTARPDPWEKNPKPAADRIWNEVMPVRPPCRHYVRQKIQGDFGDGHRMFDRLCTARRDTSGAVMGLFDQGLWACDMREPRDLESEESLDRFDAGKEIEGQNRVYLPLIGPSPDVAAASPPEPPTEPLSPAEPPARSLAEAVQDARDTWFPK
jgi:hypothetical protein